MAEDNSNDDGTGTGGDQTDPPAPTAKDDAPPEVKRALAKANKEAETLRLKLKEFEDRDKTDSQKLSDRATAAERVAAESAVKLSRFEVAAAKGLAATDVQFLTGTTEAEIAASADALLARLGTTTPKPPSFDGGARKTSAGGTDMNSLIRQTAGLSQ